MEIKSVQKFVRMSPRKLRLVADLVRGLSPQEAIDVLPFSKKRAAGPISKVIKTAIANAKQIGVNVGDLEFKEIQINEGPRLKRWRAGARGRAKPYKKRMSHIRVVLEAREPKIKKSSKKKPKPANLAESKDKKPVNVKAKRKKLINIVSKKKDKGK